MICNSMKYLDLKLLVIFTLTIGYFTSCNAQEFISPDNFNEKLKI